MASRSVFERMLPHARITVADGDRLRATVWLSGEIDAECARDLQRELLKQRLAGHKLLRLDMSTVTFLDSAALGVIAEAHSAWLAMRGTLVLLGVTGPTLRLLALTGMDRELLYMPPVARTQVLTAGSFAAV